GGGAWTLVSSLLAALPSVQSKHTFVLLDEPIATSPSAKAAPGRSAPGLARAAYRKVRPRWLSGVGGKAQQVVKRAIFKPDLDWLERLEARIRDNDIDLVWFMSPPGAVVSAPYI